MSNNDVILTSVKILDSLYKSFKKEGLDTWMTLQRLVNRSLYLYVENKEHQNAIHETTELISSGSCY